MCWCEHRLVNDYHHYIPAEYLLTAHLITSNRSNTAPPAGKSPESDTTESHFELLTAGVVDLSPGILYGRTMNIQRLKQAEEHFYALYPGGFEDPKLIEIGKKHRGGKMHAMAREAFTQEQFNRPHLVLENMVKIITRSSMVSLFEKPKFRDLAGGLIEDEIEELTQGLYHFLHKNQEKGFEMMANLLAQFKLAKWTLLTIIPAYYFPEREVFIKPTTVKRAIRYFELQGLDYKPKPSYAFYTKYRAAVQEMKKIIPVTRNNAAFGGFIMITTPEL